MIGHQAHRAQAETPKDPIATTTYKVRSGDTVSGIVACCGTAWQQLQTLNSLRTPNLIYVDGTLRIG